MSYREKEGKGTKSQWHSSSGGASSAGNNNFSRGGKDPNYGVNPLFRGRRHAPEIASKKTFPDPSIAIPYLQVNPPTSAEKDLEDKRAIERYGSSNTLLSQYWLANNYKLAAMKDFDGRKPNV